MTCEQSFGATTQTTAASRGLVPAQSHSSLQTTERTRQAAAERSLPRRLGTGERASSYEAVTIDSISITFIYKLTSMFDHLIRRVAIRIINYERDSQSLRMVGVKRPTIPKRIKSDCSVRAGRCRTVLSKQQRLFSHVENVHHAFTPPYRTRICHGARAGLVSVRDCRCPVIQGPSRSSLPPTWILFHHKDTPSLRSAGSRTGQCRS